MVGSHFDAMQSHDMIALFFWGTVPLDIFVFYYIHRISLTKPYYRCCNFLFKPMYPTYYTVLTHPNHNISSVNENQDDENKNSMHMFSQQYGRMVSNCFNTKHSFVEYSLYALQAWSFCCGFLAFYGSFVFWMNLLIQFFIISTALDNKLCVFALSALYFVFEVIFWFIRRQFESLVLITRNIGDVLDVGLLPITRIYSIVLCCLCTLWTQYNSDNVGWKYFILFMMTRGLYHQIIYVTIAFFSAVWIVITSIKQAKHWRQLICVIFPKNMDEAQTKTKSISKCTIVIWILIIIYSFFMSIPEIRHLFKVCIVMTLLYYMLIMFERGKYNALYILWRNKLSKRFFRSLPAVKHTLEDANYIPRTRKFTETPSLQIQLQPSLRSSHNSTNSIGLKHKSRSKSKSEPQFTIIDDESDDDSQDMVDIDIDDEGDHSDIMNGKHHEAGSGSSHRYNTVATVQENDDEEKPTFENTQSIAPTPMDYKQFWDKVDYNADRRCKCFVCVHSKEGNGGSFKQHCKNTCCSQDGCKWTFAVLLFVLFAFITTGIAHRWMLFELQSFDEPNHDTQSVQSYPVCDLEYNSYLSVVDLSYLAISARHHKVEDIKHDITLWFAANDEEHGWLMDDVEVRSNPYFFHIYNAKYNLHIVSIQSHPNPSLLLRDVGQWSEVAMFDIFSSVIPLTNILPKAFLRQYIEFVSLFERIIAPDIREHFDEPVYDYVKNNILLSPDVNKRNISNGTVIVIGHSVGGAVAQIVGASLYDDGYGGNEHGNIVSFGLSSPGILYSSGKFGFSVESLDKTSVSIVSRRDIIAHLDDYAGLVQNIECSAQSNEECHGSVTSFCQLYDECGDPLIRNTSFVECVCDAKRMWDDCV